MSSPWFILVISALTLGSVAVGVIRNRRFRLKELLHQKLAKKLGLQVAYLNERDFNLFGTYREYALRIEAFPILLPGEKQGPMGVKLSLPMTNPNLKSLRIGKDSDLHPELSQYRLIDRPTAFPHEVAPWLKITTNDLMFASLLLADDVKITLYEVFKPLSGALLYVQDEELAFITPRLLTEPEALQELQSVADLLCDMKDELN